MIRNPLAEPYLLGLSGGAGLGAVIAIATAGGGPWAVPVAAFLGALGAVALVYRLSLVAGRRLDPRVLLLSGVVVGSFAGALMSAIMVLSDPRPASATPSSGCWAASARRPGSRSGCSWPMPSIPLGAARASTRAAPRSARPRRGAGPSSRRRRRSDRAAWSTSAPRCSPRQAWPPAASSGSSGWWCLTPCAPSRARCIARCCRWCFSSADASWCSADVVSRTVVRPLELPVGVITALIGVPLFAVLLRRTLA